MSGLLLRVAGAFVAGFCFSQSAEITQQYLQRLGGAADALKAVLDRFDASAAAEGLSRMGAVERLRRAPDRFVARQGEDAAETIERFEDVSRRYGALRGAAPLFRPFVALSDPDWTLFGRAMGDYRPALPVTPDGFALTLTGVAGGWALGAGASGASGMRRRRMRATAGAAKS